jgi:hypothetical protein
MNDLTRAFLADTRTIAPDQIERLVEARLSALSNGVVQAVSESLAAIRRDIASKLNQSARRLRASETEEQWSKAIVDSTLGFADRAALFLLRDGELHLAATRNLSEAKPLSATSIDLAPAFQSAVESQDTVVALRTRSEMSEPIAGWCGEEPARKFCLIPIAARGRVAALLYADSVEHPVETNGLELLATVAGALLEASLSNGHGSPASNLVQLAAPKAPKETLELHLKAQRFARTQVAEMVLYKPSNVKIGRAARNLYASLKEEIDSAREVFRRDFLSVPGAMVDYLHLEIVRTLANDNVELLGPHYPGALV